MSRLIVHTAIKDPVAQLEKEKGKLHRLLFLASANPADAQNIFIHYFEAGENTVKGFSIQREEGKTLEQGVMDEFLKRHVINTHILKQEESEPDFLSHFIKKHQLAIDPLLTMASEACSKPPRFLSQTASFSDDTTFVSARRNPIIKPPSVTKSSGEASSTTPLAPKLPPRTSAFFNRKPKKTDEGGCPIICTMC